MTRTNRHERGSEMLEFGLVFPSFMLFVLWIFSAGMDLTRALQVSQVTRDAGHMYARSVDFSSPANRQMVVRLAKGLNITDSGGSGVVILSKIMFVGQPQCDAAGLPASRCTNLDQPVFVHRLTIGNVLARASAFGTPPPELVGADGAISDYLTDSRTRAEGFTNVLPLNPGDTAYLSEACLPEPAYAVPGMGNPGVYARNIF